ncbi:hypothetical protein SUGI_0929880 [Cryptomeria japonica]|uniref:uncharacterized protein LOC131072629 n=1 Tax=Cryptomeria japonica TaxID=3369 RepID=UPI0024148DC1|nr:uncharacterized protein LOC131072629 [Cryptomeria japonica]GLJ44370.1 hypothetical protein SUGI_0929880 [Cryptomeria japonica]
MEYNKDEACRAMEIAERKLAAQEVATAKKFLVKAQQLYPSLEGLPQMMAVLDVYMAAEKKVNGQTDWYGILQVDVVADEALIKKQYRKLALMLHPDKNKCAGAEGAFKLIGEAWGVLSDKIKRSVYDHKRIYVPPSANRIVQKNPKPNAAPAPAPTRPQAPPPAAHNGGFFKYTSGAPTTFWTACPFCKMQYEYLRNFLNHNLLCPNCQKPFMALETTFLHKNGQTNFAGATGMPRGGAVPYPPFSAPQTSFPHNAVPRHYNTHSASASASAPVPTSAPAPAPASAPAPAPAAPDKAKNEIPASKRKEDDLKKTDSKKEDNGRKRSVSEKSNKRRKKRSQESDSDEDIHASSVSDEDDDDVVEVVDKVKGNATSKSRSRRKDSDEEEEEEVEEEEEEDEGPENIDVPDADFHDFDKDRAPDCFKEEQIWAVYDDDDGMPRFYARIHKILKSKEFEVKMNWLEPLKKDKFVNDWLDAGFYQSNGDFKVAKKLSNGNLNIFSHIVAWEKRPKGIVRIVPQKGDVWALYKEWSCSWNEDTPPHDRHIYEMVEISTDYNDGDGVGVIPLVKIDRFKSVFQKTQLSKSISKDELRRFSHQVPAKKLSGDEREDLPKDCWELDPAATSGGGDMSTA